MELETVLVTGGAGYVGAVLVPQLLERGHQVKVIDLMIYGDVLAEHSRLELIRGDIRDRDLLQSALQGVDAVIHLACISNDPSFELDPGLGQSINYDAFKPLVSLSKEAGVKRFIYASSSSVYGISDASNVDETHPLKPLTDYSKFKAMCEADLAEFQSADFTTVTIRPATVCGYSPRQRLDLTVNILTAHAIEKGKITVFGGKQKRPNIHISDISDLYVRLLSLPTDRVAGRVYNAGYQNHPVGEIAAIVQSVLAEGTGRTVAIETTPTDDNRSYHISSQNIADDLGFVPAHTIEDAVRDLLAAFERGDLPGALTDDRYYNVRIMKRIALE